MKKSGLGKSRRIEMPASMAAKLNRQHGGKKAMSTHAGISPFFGMPDNETG